MRKELYKKLYEKQAAFYNARPRLKGTLVWTGLILTWLSVAAYLAFATVFLLVKTPTDLDVWRILFVPASCFILASEVRILIARKRPYEQDGVVPLKHKTTKGKSFPSRHVVSAFVIATVILRYLPWAGVSLLTLGAVLAYTRFAEGVHYPSDLLFGAAFGVAFGLLVFIV